MSKIDKGNFQSLWRLAQLFLDTSAVILRQKSEIFGDYFFSYENAIWSFLLKYQEIDVKNKHSLTKIETSYVIALLNGTNCRFVDYKC